MKLFRNIFVLSAILMSSFSQAQTLKLGHINSADLLEAMPEVKSADTALSLYQKELEDSYDFLVKEYQDKLEDYKAHGDSWTPTVKQLKEDDINSLHDKILQFQSDSQEMFDKKKQELYAPILKKADDAVKVVAKENNYSYIFDTSAGSVLYFWENDDILGLVKKKLNIQ